VDFVDDHVLQVREETAPARVIRQDALVEHVRVGEDHPPLITDPPALPLRSVTVVGSRETTEAGDPRTEFFHAPQLVLGQSLGRVQTENGGERILHQAFQDRYRVA
jgi:hypothetical protein